MDSKQFAGVFYLIYGVVKVLLGLSFMTPQIPLLKGFTKGHDDETLSGRMYQYVFVIFGIYTILLGLSLLHTLPARFRAVIERKSTEYTVMVVLGAFLIIFYSLVLYTNIHVDKKKENERYYVLFGIGAGVWLVLAPVLWETLSAFSPFFDGWSVEYRSMAILGLSITVALMGDAFYAYLQRNKMDDAIPTNVAYGLDTLRVVKSSI